MLNYVWLALVLLAIAIGGWNDRFKDVTAGAIAIRCTIPARSANRIKPNHKAMMPINPSAFVTAVLAPSRTACGH
jgi:hypothetical protein